MMILNFIQQANCPFYNDFLQQQTQLIEWSSNQWKNGYHRFSIIKWRIPFQNHFQLNYSVLGLVSLFILLTGICQPIRSFEKIQKNFLNMWFIWEWLCDWNSLPRLTYDFIETGSIKLRIWFDRKLWKRQKFDTRQDWITLYGFWESVLHHLDRSQVL